MENKQNQSRALVLKYNKRRFDGGTEIETIRQIEHKQAVELLNRQLAESQPAPQAPQLVQSTLPQSQLPLTDDGLGAKQARSKKLLEAWILGPTELCIGVVGIMTSLLAIFTFSRMNQPALVDQSKSVLRDCVKTFNKGLLDTVTAPVKALKIAVAA